MAEFFDEVRWNRIITKPDWYVQLGDELAALRRQWETVDTDATHRMKHEVRSFFCAALQDGRLALGSSGEDLDAPRQPIDTVVVHHTSARPGYDLDYMGAVQLLNIYVPRYSQPGPHGQNLKGQPIWSNHVRNGKPVFYVYHWLLRMDGTAERLLQDNELGWHAANWDVNRRSVGICLDNDYEHADPSPETITQLGQFIAEHYPQVAPERIFGHGEVSNHPTACPGGGFVTGTGWKQQLLAAVRAARNDHMV